MQEAISVTEIRKDHRNPAPIICDVLCKKGPLRITGFGKVGGSKTYLAFFVVHSIQLVNKFVNIFVNIYKEIKKLDR